MNITGIHKNLFPRISESIPLVLLALGMVLVHMIFNGQYGFHRDELDIIMNARHLDWGYVAYPPFTPLIARIGLILFGSSLRGLRVFSAIAQGISIILVGLMTRDLGGRRSAQLLAALAAAIAPVALMAGTLIQYMAFDYLWWIVIAFCFIRLLKTEDPRWWVGIGIGIGLGMMTKYTIVFFVTGLVAATLLTSNRRYLRSRWLWMGAGVAILIFLPNLVWQIQHDFISLDFLSAIHARDIAWGRTKDFLPEQILTSTNPFTIPFWVAGLVMLLIGSTYKRFRSLGIIYLITFGLLWFLRGRSYYVGPAYTMLLAAGAVGWEVWLSGRSQVLRKIFLWLGWGLVLLGMIVGVVLVKPIAPINSNLWETTSDVNGEVVEMIGWDDLTVQISQVYTNIPNEEKDRTVILAGNYGEAGALDLYGHSFGLPPVISGSNSMWYRGYGDFEPETVILVGFDYSSAVNFFKSCNTVGMVSNRYGVKNEETTYHNGIYVCHDPRTPWAEMWQSMQWFQ